MKSLREAQGLSLRELGLRLNLDKSKMARLEKKNWDQISFGLLQRLAVVFELDFAEFVQRMTHNTKPFLLKGNKEKPSFSLELQDGVRVYSYYPRSEALFAGILEIGSKVTLEAGNAPRSELIDFLVVDGEVLVCLCGKEYSFRKNQRFAITKKGRYELYNPDAFNPAHLSIHSSPSFLTL